MHDLLQFCQQFSPLDEETLEELAKNLKTKTVTKGDYFLRAGEVCKNLYFMNEGLAKMFFIKDDKEFINVFCPDGRLFTVFESYVTQTPSNFNLIALEPTTVTLIRYEDMERLCKKHHCMETFFRKLVSLAATKMTRRISEILEENATKRYNHFVTENNYIMKRINLGDLASYLGITQQSLSRIRAQK